MDGEGVHELYFDIILIIITSSRTDSYWTPHPPFVVADRVEVNVACDRRVNDPNSCAQINGDKLSFRAEKRRFAG